MPQLDLFGAPSSTQPENKPAEKPSSRKKEEASVLDETSGLSASAVGLAEEMLGGNKLKPRLQTSKKEEEKIVENVAPQILSLFDTLAAAEKKNDKVDGSLKPTQEYESGVASAIEVLPEPQPAVVSGVITEEMPSEILPVESTPVSSDDPGIENGVTGEKPNETQNPKRHNATEAGANRTVIFDDGKISVKIKAKTPVAPKATTKKKEKVIKEPQKRGRKSFKEIDAEVDLIEVPEDEILFQKQYYPISEVAAWFKVNTSLLRFWENEFDVLKPRKNRKGDRLFRPEDIKSLQLIYQLLRQRKYTIEGAKEYIKSNRKKADLELQLTHTLQKFKSFLLDLKANLQ